jgi:DNA-binding beta-propeller fold protein YncE
MFQNYNIIVIYMSTYTLTNINNTNSPTGTFNLPWNISTDSKYVWVSNKNDSVIQLNASSGEFISNIEAFQQPWGISSDGKNVWVADYSGGGGGGCVSQINCETSQVLTNVGPTGFVSYPSSISSDGTNVWVVNGNGSNRNSITQINCTNTNTGSNIISMTGPSGPVAAFNQPACISSDGQSVWVTNQGNNTITQIDCNTYDVVGIITGTTGQTGAFYNPWGISSDGTYVWVANQENNTIAKILCNSTSTITVIGLTGPTGVFDSPQGISSDGTYVWVTNTANNTVIQLSASTNKVLNIFSNNSGTKGGTGVTGVTGYFDYPQYVSTCEENTWVCNSGTGSNSVTLIKSKLTQPPTSTPLPQPPTSTPLPCFKEGTKILTNKGYIPIEYLNKGDMVKTADGTFKPIKIMIKKSFNNPVSKKRIPDQLYKYSKKVYTDLFEDLVLTGRHCCLVDEITNDQEEKILSFNKKIEYTNNKTRLPSFINEQTMVYDKKGKYNVYHFALNNIDETINDGIYANGLLVESCSIKICNLFSSL